MNERLTRHDLLIVSRIPVARRGGRAHADALWAADLAANAEVAGRLALLCPVRDLSPEGTVPLDGRIAVIDAGGITDEALAEAVRASDVLEIPGNFTWAESALARRALGAARREGRLSVLGISSNRARTAVMNAAGRPWPFRLRAAARAASIRLSQRHLARRCDAVRVVGEGLVPLVRGAARVLRVETASWIAEAHVLPARHGQPDPPRAAVASRLEPMKGVALALEAVARAGAAGTPVALDVIGAGPEEGALRRLAEAEGIAGRTRFLGPLGYPGPFHAALDDVDYVLLTNLNDEQPRVLFDAMARGAIPLCPASPACRALGLDGRVYYAQGSAEALAERLLALVRMPEGERRALREGLRRAALARTIATMHAERRDWLLSLLRARAGGGAAGTGVSGAP